VFRLAYGLPPIIIGDEKIEECVEELHYLSDEQRESVFTFVHALYERKAECKVEGNEEYLA
jgi:hypothetical protein